MTAIFYDVENLVEPGYYGSAIKKALELTDDTKPIQMAYAEWGRFSNTAKEIFINNAIALKQVVNGIGYSSNFKNASDIAIAADMIELVFKNKQINHFVLVSGDSGFISLIMKLREYGKRIDVISIEKNANKTILDYADSYYFIDKENNVDIVESVEADIDANEKEPEPKAKQKAKPVYEHYQKVLWAIMCNTEPGTVVSQIFKNKEINNRIKENGLSIAQIKNAYRKTVYSKTNKSELIKNFNRNINNYISRKFQQKEGMIIPKTISKKEDVVKKKSLSKKEAVEICKEYGLNFSLTDVSGKLFYEVAKNKDEYINLSDNDFKTLLRQNTKKSKQYIDGIVKTISLLNEKQKDLLSLENYQEVISSVLSMFINSASKNTSGINKSVVKSIFEW